jgi:hypothetical protein
MDFSLFASGHKIIEQTCAKKPGDLDHAKSDDRSRKLLPLRMGFCKEPKLRKQ